jgi:2,4-dienoyl-CoA reductase-like NADH-dependent reductase (Old Yellow Enzyme family)
LFFPCPIGVRLAPNRLAAQPMEANDAAEGGAVSARALQRYLRLADGGWGVVSLESTYVSATAPERFSALRLTEATAASFENLVRQFKARNPEALLLVQLSHSGGVDRPGSDPAAVPAHHEGVDHLSGDDLEAIRQQLIGAALLAQQVGLDGVDVKLCHGYLGTKLLRPANTRADAWGGTFENRTRFVTTTIRDIRARLPDSSPGFTIGSRISFYERLPGGCGTRGPANEAYDPAEPLALIELLHDLGLDFLNVSGDATETPEPKTAEEQRAGILLYERLAHARVRELEAARPREPPMAVIGSGYSALGEEMLSIAARRIAAGYTDLAGFGRQSFADPLLPRKLLEGQPVDLCRGCWACNRRMMSGHPASCVVYT